MKRTTKRKRKTAGTNKLGGWLVVVLIALILLELSAVYLLAQRIGTALTYSVQWGVYVSMFILLIYSILLLYSIYLILEKKKKAINLSIAALFFAVIFDIWYFVIGNYIFNKPLDFLSFLMNFVIVLVIIIYLKRSKRVKKTLTR